MECSTTFIYSALKNHYRTCTAQDGLVFEPTGLIKLAWYACEFAFKDRYNRIYP